MPDNSSPEWLAQFFAVFFKNYFSTFSKCVIILSLEWDILILKITLF